jgi:geranylgeranyl pyrophosphate synthase
MPHTLPLPPHLDSDLREVAQVIAERLRGRPIVEQFAGPYASGAQARAALVLLAAQVGAFDLERTLHAAAAVELIGAAVRLHTDLVDESARRRDAVAEWTGMDGNLPLMVGDYLLALAAAEMALTPDSRIIAYYSRAVMAVCEAALAPVRGPDPAAALAQYRDGAGVSAGALAEAACKAGAVCGGLDQSQVDTLGRYGVELGMALQIGDEALDIRGEGRSLRAGLITLPLIYAAEAGRSQIAALAERDPAVALAEIRRLGGDTRALEAAHRHAERALAELEPLPDSPARAALADLARWARER